MKFSDRFFKFPIRVYDGVSIKRMMKQESVAEDPADVAIPAWVKGYAKIPAWALNDLYYYDSYSPGRSVREVSKEGHDMVSIYHKDFGDFECTWKMERFEEEIDAFTANYEKYQEEQMAKESAKASKEEE